MEEKYILFTNYVYIDLLKSKVADKQFIKSIKLVIELVNRGYIIESAVIIRSTYEEIMSKLAMAADSSFIVDAKTEVRDIKKALRENTHVIYKKNSVDFESINGLYKELSNVCHSSTSKLVLKEMSKDKKMKSNARCKLLAYMACVMYTYFAYLYESKDQIEIIESLYLIVAGSLGLSSINTEKSLFPDEINKYKSYYSSKMDIKFVEGRKKEAANIQEDFNKIPDRDIILNYYFTNAENLIIKYGYKDLLNKTISKA